MREQMDRILQDFIRGGEAAGVSALLYKQGREAYFGAYGEADRETHLPFTRDTLVRIYSMSKVVTAVTALAYMEKGLFRLDDPITRYMPEFAHARIAVADAMDGVHLIKAQTPITFRHLLTMTSGIPYPSDGGNAAMRAVNEAYEASQARLEQAAARGEHVGTERVVREMAHCPLCFEPGTRWKYGYSIDVLGGLIEVMSGMTLYEAMRETVLDKLYMHDTCFTPSARQVARLAHIYERDEAGNMVRFVPEQELGSMQSGGGGLISSIDDMMRFARMLLGGGMLDGVRVLREETVREMTRSQIDPALIPGYIWDSEVGYHYGLGVRVMRDPEKSEYDEPVGAFGWNGMAGTSLRVSPEDGQAAIFFVQNIPAKHEVFLPSFTRAARGL